MPRASARRDALRDIKECMKFAVLFGAAFDSETESSSDSDNEDDAGGMDIDTGIDSLQQHPFLVNENCQNDLYESAPLDRFDTYPLDSLDRFDTCALDSLDGFDYSPLDRLAFQGSNTTSEDHETGWQQVSHDTSLESYLDFLGSSDSDSDGAEVMAILGSTHDAIADARYLLDRFRIPKCIEFRYTYFQLLPDDDFRVITRLSREIFEFVLKLIEDDPVFSNNSPFQQAPVHWQLAYALDRLGNDGQGVSLARSKLVWGLGHGTVLLYYRRVVFALCNMRNTFISWPDREERGRISGEMESYGFKGAVGFVDGTTFPLQVKPSLHGPSYFDRKRRYSIHGQILCDNKYIIRHLQTGMPGSCHDSGVFSNSPILCNPDRFFSRGEYLISDSAYAASRYVVPAYRLGAIDQVDDPLEVRNIERFNTYLSQARVVNEHTIGIAKARWTSLRGMRTVLRKEGDIIMVIRHVVACVILHNIAMERDPWDEEIEEECEADVDEVIPQAPLPGRRLINAGQQKRLEVRNACLAYHDTNFEDEDDV